MRREQYALEKARRRVVNMLDPEELGGLCRAQGIVRGLSCPSISDMRRLLVEKWNKKTTERVLELIERDLNVSEDA